MPWRRDRLPTSAFLSFPCGSAGKESACKVGDLGVILGLGRVPEKWNGYSLQCSCLENPMNRGVWQAIVHGVTKSRTQPSDSPFVPTLAQLWSCVHSLKELVWGSLTPGCLRAFTTTYCLKIALKLPFPLCGQL